MKSSNFLLLILALALMACNVSPKLPRTQASPAQKAAFDSLFPIVWGDGVNELHTLLIVQDGKVLYERSDPAHDTEMLHVLWSASKTFTATAVGFAVQDGLLGVEDRVVDLIPGFCPAERPAWLEEMTVWHLLTMSSGLSLSPTSSDCRRGDVSDWARASLAAPMRFRPGEFFEYNSMETYLLSVIVSEVTGERVDRYLERKLFRPLGIREYHWDASPQDYSTGGWGLFLSAESMAKMGQFMLQKGEWNGRRLLDASWFDAAMSPQIMQYQGRSSETERIEQGRPADDWNQGYGYQMWCCQHGAFRLDGAWSQYCIIIPSKRAVVVALSHCNNGRILLDAVWDHILPNL